MSYHIQHKHYRLPAWQGMRKGCGILKVNHGDKRYWAVILGQYMASGFYFNPIVLESIFDSSCYSQRSHLRLQTCFAHDHPRKEQQAGVHTPIWMCYENNRRRCNLAALCYEKNNSLPCWWHCIPRKYGRWEKIKVIWHTHTRQTVVEFDTSLQLLIMNSPTIKLIAFRSGVGVGFGVGNNKTGRRGGQCCRKILGNRG